MASATRDAVAIGARKGRVVEFADERETAEERFGEAHAFFLGEADDFEGEGHSLPCRCASSAISSASVDAEDDAEDSVERAGIRDRVQVGADEQARCVGLVPRAERRADFPRRRRGLACPAARIQPPSSA